MGACMFSNESDSHMQPPEQPFFRVVTFCPRKYESAWSWSFPRGRRVKVYYDCRSVVKLREPGIYKLLSNRGRRGDDDSSAACVEYLRTRRGKIHYFRLFPATARPIILNGVNGISIGREFFAHGLHACDVILAANLPEFSERPPHPRVVESGREVYQRFDL